MKTDSSVINVRAFQTVALATRSRATRPSIFLPRASFGLCPCHAPPSPSLPSPILWPSCPDTLCLLTPFATGHDESFKLMRRRMSEQMIASCHYPAPLPPFPPAPSFHSQSQYCPSRYWTRWRLNDSHTKYDNGAKISRLVSRDATLLLMITF